MVPRKRFDISHSKDAEPDLPIFLSAFTWNILKLKLKGKDFEDMLVEFYHVNGKNQ